MIRWRNFHPEGPQKRVSISNHKYRLCIENVYDFYLFLYSSLHANIWSLAGHRVAYLSKEKISLNSPFKDVNSVAGKDYHDKE